MKKLTVMLLLLLLLTFGCSNQVTKVENNYSNNSTIIKNLSSNQEYQQICERTGGIWIQKGSEEECGNLSIGDCSKNQNCVTAVVNERPTCAQFLWCHCPDNRTSYYFKEGCT
ncbi:hypothetical protein HYY73_03175 [Candidatus Woesearchaeota archaeon]|nr:hypothetical protein [Candidatus Woesearchaeota archaeon]